MAARPRSPARRAQRGGLRRAVGPASIRPGPAAGRRGDLMYRLPLSGIRVLDLTMAWAGPYAARLLGDMGAEVIKIESTGNWDVMRSLHLLGRDVERSYNKAGIFNHLNRNKLGCALDLSQPRGKELFLKLVARRDAGLEGHRADVLDGRPPSHPP